ncbi:MAG: molybdenum ABC transporter ATP-binding protein [Pseudomonadota bacterium]
MLLIGDQGRPFTQCLVVSILDIQLNINQPALKLDVHAQIRGEGITAIFGESGLGKTTLLRAIAGFDNHEGATFVSSMQNQSIWQDQTEFVLPEDRAIGYCAQAPCLFPHLNVEENLRYAMRRADRYGNALGFVQLVESFQLGELLKKFDQQLSGGEKQRVSLARAFASNPSLLLLDEPVSALDVPTRRYTLQVVKSLTTDLGIPAVLVTHSIDEVSLVADELLLMQRDQNHVQGSTMDLLTRLDLPLAHSQDARALVLGEVVDHDEKYDLSYVENGAGRFSLLSLANKVGEQVRMAFAARDVSLSLEANTDSSILNSIEATVIEVMPSGRGQSLVLLQRSGIHFLSRITRKSAEQLSLAPGASVFMHAKSIALF